MHSENNRDSMDYWLDAVHREFKDNANDLLDLFHVYAEEAKFGRTYIDSDIDTISPGGKILEVGAGSLLLSCQLIREGFQVTSLEPIGDGFSHFDRMRNIVLKVARDFDISPIILDAKAEALTVYDYFDYAFSINVMEHVDDVQQVIERVGHSLCKNAMYRFTCPNYSFPYEPHFNIPTLFSKSLTEKVFYNKIFEHEMSDPKGTWESLNWITVSSVKKIIKSQPLLTLKCNQSMLSIMFARINTDKEFANRRSSIVIKIIRMIVFLRLHLLFSMIPASLQPVMDCVISKCESLEGV
jgi:2-polyprenyl-3-methyl-5-hydroxy-6-metoxy-1,4-benzoquinol methylase